MSDFDEFPVRVECMFYIPSLTADIESSPKAFEDEFCHYLPERKDAPLWKQMSRLKRFMDGDDYPEAWQVLEAMIGVGGFLVQAATPVMMEGNMYSWGQYYTEWLYAPTETDIGPMCLKWAQSTRKRGSRAAA